MIASVKKNPATADQEEKILKKFYQTKSDLHRSVCEAVTNLSNSERAVGIIEEKISALPDPERKLLKKIISGNLDLEKGDQKQTYNNLVSSLKDLTPLSKFQVIALLRALFIRSKHTEIKVKCKEVVNFEAFFH